MASEAWIVSYPQYLSSFGLILTVPELSTLQVWSKFRKVLPFSSGTAPELKNNILTREEVLQFIHLLQCGQQAQLQQEYDLTSDSDIADTGRIYCSGCRTAHTLTQFSVAQHSQPHVSRVCVGLEGSLRQGQHVNICSSCLLNGLRNPGRLQFSCTAPHSLGDDGWDIIGHWDQDPCIISHADTSSLSMR